MIKIDDDIFISVNQYEYTLCRDCHKQNKKGEEITEIIGRYSTLSGAMGGLRDYRMKKYASEDVRSLTDALTELTRLNDEIGEMLKEVTGDD